MAPEVLDARTRLRGTLEGLATGDAFGERAFQEGTEYRQALAQQRTCCPLHAVDCFNRRVTNAQSCS